MSEQLATDIDMTIERMTDLLKLTEDDGEDLPQGMPFAGVDTMELVGMLRPILYQWAMANPDRALDAMAVIHVATGDVVTQHAESDAEELYENAVGL